MKQLSVVLLNKSAAPFYYNGPRYVLKLLLSEISQNLANESTTTEAREEITTYLELSKF